MRKIFLDRFLLSLLFAIIIASLFPLSGVAESGFAQLTKLAVALLFFLHGARLSRGAVIAGFTHWRLHLMVLGCTFILFPLLGIMALCFIPYLSSSPFYVGMLYLCILPSTVQSSIAFTSLAGGNIPAAIVSASASNILGIFITPLLLSLILTSSLTGENLISLDVFLNILLQLFFPFILGQILQPWLGDFLNARKKMTTLVDRGSIIMVVFLAFSEASKTQIWSLVSWQDLFLMLIFDGVLLGLILTITWFGAKWLHFNLSDRITIMFCGSKKSLASGAPMANVIFAQSAIFNIGLIIVPVMFFHQIQLIACTMIAQHLSQRQERKHG